MSVYDDFSNELYIDKIRSEMFVSSVMNPETGCIEWTGRLNPNGYGQMYYKGAQAWVHRVAWIVENGKIPKGEGHHGTCVCHKCDNPRCINTDHMFLGSITDNMKDRDRKGRGIGGKNQAKYVEMNHVFDT